jgi:hypothetical protein
MMRQEVIAIIFFGILGPIFFLYYLRIRNKKGGVILRNQKFGSLMFSIACIVYIIILLYRIKNT